MMTWKKRPSIQPLEPHLSIPDLEPPQVNVKPVEALHKRRILQTVKGELKELTKLGWPVVLTQCLYYTIATVAIIFAGHQGKIELDVIAMSTVILNITAIDVAHGLSGYCDTLFSQGKRCINENLCVVYGSKDKIRLGAVLQKCLLIMSVGICPCLAVHINLWPLLQLLGYDSELARLTEQYLMIHIPGTIAAFFYIVLAKYVQNQNKEIPILIIVAIGNVVNVVLHAVFFVWLETGSWGSAVSMCMTYVTLLICTIIYIMWSGIYKETWQGWTLESFLTWGQYCRLGTYSLMIHLVECWAFEIGIVLSGLIGVDFLAAQSISYQIIVTLYTIAWGIGIAAGIRVGQHLGANDPDAAKLSTRVTLGTAAILGFFLAVLLVSTRHYIPLIYTTDSNVIELVASVMPIMGVLIVFDYVGAVINGVLRGSGRQEIGIAFTIPAMIFVLVCGLTVMFKTSLHIKGYWLAVMLAIIYHATVGTIFLCRLNWKEEAEKAQLRVKTSGGRDSGTTELRKVPEEDVHNVSVDLPKDEEAPEHFTKKVILYRTVAFSLSIGCLVAGIIARTVVYIADSGTGDLSLSMGNVTTMATSNATLVI